MPIALEASMLLHRHSRRQLQSWTRSMKTRTKTARWSCSFWEIILQWVPVYQKFFWLWPSFTFLVYVFSSDVLVILKMICNTSPQHFSDSTCCFVMWATNPGFKGCISIWLLAVETF